MTGNYASVTVICSSVFLCEFWERNIFGETLPSTQFSHDIVFFLFAYQWGLQPEINLFGGAMVN